MVCLRYWLRSVRESGYLLLSLVGRHCPAFWSHHLPLAPPLTAALSANLEALPARDLRMLIRHVYLPWLQYCPPPLRPHWLLPPLATLSRHMHARLVTGAQPAMLVVCCGLQSP